MTVASRCIKQFFCMRRTSEKRNRCDSASDVYRQDRLKAIFRVATTWCALLTSLVAESFIHLLTNLLRTQHPTMNVMTTFSTIYLHVHSTKPLLHHHCHHHHHNDCCMLIFKLKIISHQSMIHVNQTLRENLHSSGVYYKIMHMQ